MTRALVFTLMPALALLAACGGGADNRGASVATGNGTVGSAPAGTNNMAAAPMADSSAQPGLVDGRPPVDAAFLTANPWARSTRCDDAVTFSPDGTASSGGERGTWTLAGDRLTLTRSGRPAEIAVASRSGRDMILKEVSSGEQVIVSPCPAGSGASPPNVERGNRSR